MKGLLTPRQLKQIERDRYDLYEVLVAKHMWRVIKRELPNVRFGTKCVSDVKKRIVVKYNVQWRSACLLCEMYRDSKACCNGCPLGDCGIGSPYDEAEHGSVLACDEIIEAIEKDAKERGVYDD